MKNEGLVVGNVCKHLPPHKSFGSSNFLSERAMYLFVPEIKYLKVQDI